MLLEKKARHLHRDGLYRQQLVTNLVHIEMLNINWCLGNIMRGLSQLTLLQYFSVPKVASSSMSRALLPFLQNKTDGKTKQFPFVQAEVWDRAGHMKYEDFLSGQNVTPTFLISRHPLTRLVSAYRNKLQPGTRTVEYFIKEYAKVISSKARGSWQSGDPDPTFSEFVKYLINTRMENFDEHWMPVALRCRVCQVPHDFILHYEDLEVDWEQFLKEVNITENIKLPWENKGHGDIASYYHNISREDLAGLYRKYEADFLMFGYSIENIIKDPS